MAIPAIRTEIKGLVLLVLWAVFGLGYFVRFPLPGFVTVVYALLFAIVVTASAWGYGAVLMGHPLFDLAPVEESFVLATTAGWGILSLLMVLAGAVGGWTRTGATVIVVAGLCLMWRSRKHAAALLRSIPRLAEEIPKIPLLLLTLGAGLSLLAAFAPITFYDSLVYHFALPNAYLQAGRWVGLPELIYSSFPQTMEMLWTLGMLLVNDLLSNLFGWILAMLGIAAVYLFGRRFVGTKTAAWSSALLAAMPAYVLLSTGGYIDVGLAVFSFISFYALWLWAQAAGSSPTAAAPDRLLVLAGFFAGCAVGCKYTGAIPLAIGSLLLLKETFSLTWKKILMTQTLYAGTALLVLSPWLIKNLHYVGNPVFPFFCQWSFTHQNPWIASAATGYFRALVEYHPRSGWTLLTLVWDVAVNGLGFGGGMDVLGDMGWAPFFALLPALWLARKSHRTVSALLIYIVCFFIPWGMSRPVLRFLMPLAPFMALTAGYAIDRGISTQAPLFRRLSALFIGSLLLSGFRAYFDFTDFLSLYHVPLGIEARSNFLARKLNYFSAAGFVNTLPANSLTYVVGDQRGYYYNRPVIVTPVFNTNPLTGWANESSSAEDLLARLKSRGITHLLVNDTEMARLDRAYHLFPFTPKGRSNWVQLRSRVASSLYHDAHCEVLALPS